MKRSRLTCDEWKCITSKRFKQISVNKEFFTGIVAGLFIYEVTTPQVWKYRGKDVFVCDKDMKWVLIMPEKEHYLITAMLDKNDISQELFNLAIETSNSLKSNFLSDVKKIEELTKKCFNEVRSIL